MNKKEQSQKKSYQKSSSTPFEIDQDVKNIDLKPIEKKRLDIVYEELSKLEQEASSDEDSLTKKYLKEVEKNANLKKMNKQDFNNNNSNNINSNNNNSIYNNKKSKKSKKDLKEERRK